MLRQCIICGIEFVPGYRSYRQKCCSKECSSVNKKRYKESDRYKQLQKEYGLKYMKVYRRLKKYKDAHRELGRKYKQTDKYKQWAKEYCKREDVRERHKKSSNSESYKKWRKEWSKGEVGKIICSRSRIRRRARKNNYIETYTEKEWLDKVNITKGICPGFKVKPHYVGIDKLTRDHDYPISEASKDFIRTGIKRIYAIDNIYPLCIACNSRKHIRFIEHPKAKPKDLNTIYN